MCWCWCCFLSLIQRIVLVAACLHQKHDYNFVEFVASPICIYCMCVCVFAQAYCSIFDRYIELRAWIIWKASPMSAIFWMKCHCFHCPPLSLHQLQKVCLSISWMFNVLVALFLSIVFNTHIHIHTNTPIESCSCRIHI